MKIEEGDWEAFEAWLGNLRRESGFSPNSPLLFRGQGDSAWSLETTLERAGQRQMAIDEYYRLITVQIGPAVGAFAGTEIPEFDRDLVGKFHGGIDTFFDPDLLPSGLLYQYMVYLRHHGFPSPLLDWSHSPYVAVFFAFRNPNSKSEKRSIYGYRESATGSKGGAVGEPTIRSLGPYVQGHPRHFRQQSAYTICESLADNNATWRYDSHQHVFDHARPGQDLLWRFDLPSSEGMKILKILNDYNLNAYSLFDTEETLLEMTWLREKILRKN